MLNFTGHSRKWCWQPRFEVKRGPGVKHFLLTWKHIQAHLALGVCRRPSPLLPTICTYIIWGSSGPNKSHVLITFEGVMTSGPQPIFIWFQSEGRWTGYASDTLQSSLSDSTCVPCSLCRCLAMPPDFCDTAVSSSAELHDFSPSFVDS